MSKSYFILIQNITIFLEDFEEEKKETKQTSKMKITEKYIKVINGETYLDDEMRSILFHKQIGWKTDFN